MFQPSKGNRMYYSVSVTLESRTCEHAGFFCLRHNPSLTGNTGKISIVKKARIWHGAMKDNFQ